MVSPYYAEALAHRLTAAVRVRLGNASITFDHWEYDAKTGASAPVFGVAASQQAAAEALKLRVVVVR